MGTDDKQKPLAEALNYMQSGTMIVAPMLGLGALGYWLDGRWGTKPWLMLAGLLVGMIGGFVNFFRFVLRPPGDGPPR
ncbi:MAG TPA: AtpZ/AtpI family protein [Patescibacteria group bacterium]|nr:AtpZ/AtpI family protein [Patescibacteria group bacterium]